MESRSPVAIMSVLLLVLPLSVPWALALLHLEDLPVYIDSVQAIGAGAELAYNGHFSSTWMLYGLINPFLLEALLRVGFGSAACSIFRLFQLFWLALGVLGIVLTLRKLLAASAGGFRTAFLDIIPVVLGSTVLLIESLELTPEAIGFCAMSLLLLACVSYDGSMKSTKTRSGDCFPDRHSTYRSDAGSARSPLRRWPCRFRILDEKVLDPGAADPHVSTSPVGWFRRAGFADRDYSDPGCIGCGSICRLHDERPGEA